MAGTSWTITDGNGMQHQIEYKVKTWGGAQITVDGNIYKVKSSNWFVNLIDYSIDFPGVNCHVIVIGKKVRLAVNGTYNDDGTAYEPIANIPAWIYVLVVLSVVGGWFFGGLICMAIGLLFSTVYISAALEKKTGKVITFFIIFVVICIVFLGLNLALQGIV